MKKIDRRLVLGLAAGAWAAVFLCGATVRVLADCASYGLPFTDLGAETTFCAAIAEAYYTGITSGTSATTFEPAANVTREQAAAFATRTLDAGLARGSRRAALGQWWTTTPLYESGLGSTDINRTAPSIKGDGQDIWVANFDENSVLRVRASDGKLIETWTGATQAYGVLVAVGRVFVTGGNGSLYMINPALQPGDVTVVVNDLPDSPRGISFDGENIWTLNDGEVGSVSVITPGSWSVQTFSAGMSRPSGLEFDGKNMWITSWGDHSIKKFNKDHSVALSVPVLEGPVSPAFDGANLWIPGSAPPYGLSVVRVSDGTLIKTFSDGNGNRNGLTTPYQAAFDGQRILVTNLSGDSVSLFNASTLSAIGAYPLGLGPYSYVSGVCSDGINFWFAAAGKLLRF